ncbi:hypothetical protein Hanom_Chr03g00214601 [Helianthus anomalus]
MDNGGSDEGFVLCFLRGGFCGEGFSFGVTVGGFLEPSVVGFCGGDFGLGNVARGGVVPFIFARASLMPLISACVSLYLASTITLISPMWELC